MVLELDRVQDHGYVVLEEGTGVEKRVDLQRTKQRPETYQLTKKGEWQLMPNQPSIQPYSWDAMICTRCYSQSSRPPCVMCSGGGMDATHGIIIGGQLRTPSVLLSNQMAVKGSIDEQPRAASAAIPHAAPAAGLAAH